MAKNVIHIFILMYTTQNTNWSRKQQQTNFSNCYIHISSTFALTHQFQLCIHVCACTTITYNNQSPETEITSTKIYIIINAWWIKSKQIRNINTDSIRALLYIYIYILNLGSETNHDFQYLRRLRPFYSIWVGLKLPNSLIFHFSYVIYHRAMSMGR